METKSKRAVEHRFVDYEHVGVDGLMGGQGREDDEIGRYGVILVVSVLVFMALVVLAAADKAFRWGVLS